MTSLPFLPICMYTFVIVSIPFSQFLTLELHRQTVAPDFYLDPVKDAPKKQR